MKDKINWKSKAYKIAVTGPESSGKTTLVEQLHDVLGLPVAKEFAREYFQNKPINHSEETIHYIARQQIRAEENALAHGQSILCDSDLINMKIWLNYYGYPSPDFIENHLTTKAYEFSLLLYPNVPWVEDGLRSNPNDRVELFERFEHELKHYNINYVIIKDIDEERTNTAFRAIQNYFSKV